MVQDAQRVEALGPAERIVKALTQFTDHLVHNRPGMITPDARANIGVKWQPVTWKMEDDKKVVYTVAKEKADRKKIGQLWADGTIRDGRKKVGEFRTSGGLFPEVAVYLYRQVADVFVMDNEFAAKWASYSFGLEHKDMKVILAAFLLAQDRMGEPVKDDGQVIFNDEDYRAVGEAMCLIRAAKDMSPKLMLRIGDVLALDGVAAINRELGFGKSARNPHLGRYKLTVKKWLQYREQNPRMLDGLVKGGMRNIVMKLAQRCHYKPSTPYFFKVLRWKQVQAKDGWRELAIGEAVEAAESWVGMSEQAICEKIMADKPNYKRIVGLLPADVGLTQAVMAAAVEAGSLSNADLIILTPTLEDLGLLKDRAVSKRWKEAINAAENQRAANVAKNVKSQEAKEGLQEAADVAVAKKFKEVTKDLRVYVYVDKSASMRGAIIKAIEYLTKFLGGFPPDKLHVCVFNTVGTEIKIKSPTKAGVEHAFRGHTDGGGTSYSAAVHKLGHYRPLPEEDVLYLFIGDQEGESGTDLADYVRRTAHNPVAFGMLTVKGTWGYGGGRPGTTVEDAAKILEIPCFPIEEGLFDDPYAVVRVLRDLIANTPVGKDKLADPYRTAPRRKTLVETILETELLQKPVWA